MQLAFCLYQYFPHGGMERDFLKTAQLCRERGHQVRVYVWRWRGPQPEGMEIIHAPVRALQRITLYRRYWNWVRRHLDAHPVDLCIGFNRASWMDLCFDADGCYAEEIRRSRSAFYRLTPRCRYFLREEKALFSSNCRVLTLTQKNIAHYRRHYRVAEDAIELLPPGIEGDRRRPQNAETIRADFLREYGIDAQARILLMIGSDYARKGLDRSLRALAALPAPLRENAHLFVLGRGRPGAFLRLARRLGVQRRLHLLGGRDDAPRFLFSADALLHPARQETAGAAILEAVVAGLPAIAAGTCGYAPHLTASGAGVALTEPFSQKEFNMRLAETLSSPDALGAYRENGLRYAREQDLYGRTQRIVEIIERSARKK